jgi:L-alanine-DL-glutamate epimerase-like enolase superfamily enzyme
MDSKDLRRRGIIMAIEKAEVFVTSPARNFVVLKLTTTDGIVDLGDAALNGRELVTAEYLKTIAPTLIRKAMEPYDLFWMEDTTPAEDNLQFLRLVREHTTPPSPSVRSSIRGPTTSP